VAATDARGVEQILLGMVEEQPVRLVVPGGQICGLRQPLARIGERIDVGGSGPRT
jgi:hypothetical protein